MTQLRSVFKALSDLNRLRIVNILSHQSLCVGDLQGVLGLPQSLMSRHLAYLRRAGLVRDQRAGARVNYSLALDGPLGVALSSFLGEALPLSETFRADSARLRECLRAGQLRSAALHIAGEETQSLRAA